MTNANDNETVQERIYRIMRSKKMQQSLVAKDAGFAPKDFNNMLKGRKLIRPEHIVPLCKDKREVKTTCRDQIEISQSIHAFLISRHQE